MIWMMDDDGDQPWQAGKIGKALLQSFIAGKFIDIRVTFRHVTEGYDADLTNSIGDSMLKGIYCS